jgi:hypothetical protein
MTEYVQGVRFPDDQTLAAREQLKQGFKERISSDLFKGQQSTGFPVAKSTKTIIVDDL